MHYQVGGSLTTQAPSYIERQADDDLIAAIGRGEFCYVLNSRQMGKSSLMVRAYQTFSQADYRCAVLDMTNIGSENITPLQWYKGIVKNLWRGFKLNRQCDLNFKAWWKDEEDISLLQRLSQFIKDVLLAQFPDDELIIFVDEIDSILSLPFSVDDFFALVRFCYNQRAIDPECNRIHFAIFGVAIPADLIRDRNRTPFNIGTPIYLGGFSQQEAQPLAQGLSVQAGDVQAVLKAILSWTGGQPFLTQKLCQLAVSSSQGAATRPLTIPPGGEAYWVENLVQTKILERWESQDEPEHLRTIRNRILSSSEIAGRVLSIYQQVLEGDVVADDSRDQIELLLSGLVTKSTGLLTVKNRIYSTVFDLAWVKSQLDQLRPYSQQFDAWMTSAQVDDSRLLRGQALQEAQVWSQGKRLSDGDYRYLAASVESDRQAVRQAMDAERQAAENERVQLQLEKERETGKLQRRFLGAVSAAFLAAVGFGGVIFWQYRQSQLGEIKAIATAAEGRFESHHQLEAFEQIITAATKLQRLFDPPEALSKQVKMVLQRTLDGANAINQLNFDTEISSLEIHPDGELLAVVTAGGELSFWHPSGERAAGAVVQAIQTKNEAGQFSKVLFSPDGNQIAVSLNNNLIQLWDLEGTLLKASEQPDSFELRAFSRDNRTFLIRSQDALKLLNLDSGALTPLPSEARIGTSVVSPDGEMIVANYRRTPRGARPDGSGPVMSRNLNTVVPLPKRPGGPLRKKGGPRDANFFQKPTIGVWDTAGNLTSAFAPTGGPVEAIAISPNSELLATAHVDGEVYLSRPNGEFVEILFGLQSKVQALAFSPDGQLLAAGDIDGNIELWSVGGSQLGRILGHKGKITALRFSPDGTWLASASQDSTVRLWQTSHPMQTVLANHTDNVTGLFYSPDGKQLRSHSIDQSLNIWQRNPQGEFMIAPAETLAVAGGPNSFSVSADRLLMARMRKTGGLIVTDDAAGKNLVPLRGGVKQASAVSIAPSGERIAVATTAQQIQIWHKTTAGVFPAQPQVTWPAPNGVIESLAWSPDEAMLVAGTGEGTVTLWETKEDIGSKIASVEEAHDADVSAVAVSPDGRWIASASKDKTVKIWRIDGTLMQTLAGHEAGVDAITFSPDSAKLASVSVDSSLKLWVIGGLSPGQEPLLRSLTGHTGRINAVTFSPDGKEIATSGSDRKVIVWKVEEILQLDELDYACNQVRDYFRYSLRVDDKVRSLCNE
ncbi:MAG: AAA-like domain-containing protein [Cyanobacteria bacterium P01_F01_bin.53]